MFDNYTDVENKARHLKEMENAGDSITHEIVQRLHGTFVTPIDREDIAHLAHTLDDVMDYIEAAGRTAFLYRVEQPTQRARELCAVIVEMTDKLNHVLPLLRRREKFPHILKGCVEINRLENQADDIHHSAQAELFDGSRDACDVIKWREIYQHLENATDKGEGVANILEGVVLKNA